MKKELLNEIKLIKKRMGLLITEGIGGGLIDSIITSLETSVKNALARDLKDAEKDVVKSLLDGSIKADNPRFVDNIVKTGVARELNKEIDNAISGLEATKTFNQNNPNSVNLLSQLDAQITELKGLKDEVEVKMNEVQNSPLNRPKPKEDNIEGKESIEQIDKRNTNVYGQNWTEYKNRVNSLSNLTDTLKYTLYNDYKNYANYSFAELQVEFESMKSKMGTAKLKKFKQILKVIFGENWKKTLGRAGIVVAIVLAAKAIKCATELTDCIFGIGSHIMDKFFGEDSKPTPVAPPRSNDTEPTPPPSDNGNSEQTPSDDGEPNQKDA